jgi:hypothetical protein
VGDFFGEKITHTSFLLYRCENASNVLLPDTLLPDRQLARYDASTALGSCSRRALDQYFSPLLTHHEERSEWSLVRNKALFHSYGYGLRKYRVAHWTRYMVKDLALAYADAITVHLAALPLASELPVFVY